jgi:hypothetical protein
VVLSGVRYYDLDYKREEIAPGHQGPRVAEDEAEWSDPAWRFPLGHTVDFGVELTTNAGQVWSVTWIPPGRMEGLAVDDKPLLADIPRAAVAVWDVSVRSEWEPLIGQRVDQVGITYVPWDGSGAWWCSRIELSSRRHSVEILVAQGRPDGTVEPSANNIVLRFKNT